MSIGSLSSLPTARIGVVELCGQLVEVGHGGLKVVDEAVDRGFAKMAGDDGEVAGYGVDILGDAFYIPCHRRQLCRSLVELAQGGVELGRYVVESAYACLQCRVGHQGVEAREQGVDLGDDGIDCRQPGSR